MCIKIEKKQHMERLVKIHTYIYTYIYIYIYIKKISIMYVNKWLQDQYTLGKGKKRKEIIRTSLHPSKFINTPSIKNVLY